MSAHSHVAVFIDDAEDIAVSSTVTLALTLGSVNLHLPIEPKDALTVIAAMQVALRHMAERAEVEAARKASEGVLGR